MNPSENTAPGRPPSQAVRNDALDGLRGAAIALVLWLHFVQQYLPPGRGSWLGWLRAGTGLAWSGVDLFFVLSGFLIGGILIDEQASPRLIKVFYLRRAVRILPIYFLTLAAIGVAIAARLPGSYHLFPAWIYALFLTNFAFAWAKAWDWLPLSVLWTLAVEEQFYLTAPWVVRALRRRMIPVLALSLVILAELARVGMILAVPGNPFAIHVLTPFRMDTLALGVFVAWLVRNPAPGRGLRFLREHGNGALFLALAVLAAIGLGQPSQGSRSLAIYGYLAIAMAYALIVLTVAWVRPPALNRWLSCRPLALLGRHSYFIYLWHGLLGGTLIRWLGGPDFTLHSAPGAGLVILAVAFTWGAAALSWRYVEGPLVAWGRGHAY